MQTEKEQLDPGMDTEVDPTESSREATLNWLLDLDRDEPEESLFVVERSDDFDLGLTDYEAEVASRPMVRGRAGADDLDSYVAEEIVFSSDVMDGNIYDSDKGAAVEDDFEFPEETMAVDYSRNGSGDVEQIVMDIADGADILGLLDDDDIGEQYMVVKRVKRNGVTKPEASPPAAVEQTPAAVDDTPATVASEPVAAEEIEELVALHPEGEESVDPEVGEEIDYHQDFTDLEDFDGQRVASLTPHIPALMEEVSAVLEQRLQFMGLPAASVRAEVVLGIAPQEVDQALEQGYEPLSIVCPVSLDALQVLVGEDSNVIYLRLLEVASGECRNRLFYEDLVAAPAADKPESRLRAVPVEEQDIFGEDLLAAEPVADFGEDDWAPESADIEALFDELGAADPDAAFADFSDETQRAPESVETDSAPAQAPAVASEPEMQVFDEDIFALDPAADGELSMEAAPEADLDAMLEELAPVEDGDDICGLPVDEFKATGEVPDEEFAEAEPLAPAAELAQPELDAVDEDLSWAIPTGINFSHSSQSGAEIFAEFIDAFLEEGASELEKLEDAITAWEADISAEEPFAAVTRGLHTIKGIAKGVGLQYYGTLIHNFETLLEALPRPEAGEEQGYFRIINTWLDAAVRGMDHVQEQRADILSEFPQRPGAAAVAAPASEEQAPAAVEDNEPQALVAEPVRPSAGVTAGEARRRQADKKLADDGARALAAQQSVRITSEKLDLLLNLSNQAQQLGVRTAQSTTRNKRASAELQGRLSSVRAHIADIADRALLNVSSRGAHQGGRELDALEMDQYTELQEAANILREGVEDIADLIEIASRHNSQAEALLKQQASVISSIGSSIRAARVVPVSRLMPGLRRLVRTVSTDLGKDVSFRVINEVGTLDRDDYARCQTVLEHMVRNALDHGIESAEEREVAAKEAAGRITIDIRMEGADSVIVLSDDGRGIDPEAMRESALRKGLDVEVDALTDAEALNLIFHKGFSTATTLSQISGRGVGMDIVLSELQAMGGDIRIESQVGKGTSFHIRIPSNVTVNGALLVTAGESSYAVPLGGLILVDQIPADEFFGAVEQGEALNISGTSCEPAYLGTLCEGGKLPDRNFWGESVPVILAGGAARHMAIAIDDVEEALELVIRSLGTQFAEVPGVAGAATTADGEAVVALDLNLLVSRYSQDVSAALTDDKAENDTVLALVVDDSRTQRMVATSQLETVGIETITAEHGGIAIDLLNSADRLPDIILLDVEMPVKDGIQTLREIRKSVRYSHIPVIMVTSRTGLKHRAMAQEAGCNGYMGKPFNFNMLVGQINELTGQRLDLS